MIARTTGGGSGATCTTVWARRWAGSRCGWMRRATRCRPTRNGSRVLISQARTEIADALADVRRLVHGLRPPALDDLGLPAAVEQQADRVRSAELAVEVDIAPLPRLGAAVEVAAFRIVSEGAHQRRHAMLGRRIAGSGCGPPTAS